MTDTTRMLLASDGSTTVLLESLLERPLSVTVLQQRTVTAGRAPAPAVQALGLVADEPVVLRHSALLTSDGEHISHNTVVYAEPPRGWAGQADDPVPLGHRLRSAGTLQHRALLSSGQALWTHGQPAPCAYKEYVIHCDDHSRLYVHERFNPRRIVAPARQERQRARA